MSGSNHGHLAEQFSRVRYPLRVLSSAAGYYIGTADERGLPFSRESAEYFPTKDAALRALETGAWTQREHP